MALTVQEVVVMVVVTGMCVVKFLSEVLYVQDKKRCPLHGNRGWSHKRNRRLKTGFSFQLYFSLILHLSHRCVGVFS